MRPKSVFHRRAYPRPAGANPGSTSGASSTDTSMSSTDDSGKSPTDSIGTLDPSKLARFGIPTRAITQTTPASTTPATSTTSTWASLSTNEKWMVGGVGLLLLVGLGYVLTKSKAA